MTARATETAALSKIVRIMMSVALFVGMCVSAPMQAQAAESVEVTVGDDVPLRRLYFTTTRMWADGEVAYCAEPAAGTPAPGTYSKSASPTAVTWPPRCGSATARRASTSPCSRKGGMTERLERGQSTWWRAT